MDNKIVIHIKGGTLVSVYSKTGNIEVILIDEDNLKAEGVTSKKIQSLLAKETKELTETEVN